LIALLNIIVIFMPPIAIADENQARQSCFEINTRFCHSNFYSCMGPDFRQFNNNRPYCSTTFNQCVEEAKNHCHISPPIPISIPANPIGDAGWPAPSGCNVPSRNPVRKNGEFIWVSTCGGYASGEGNQKSGYYKACSAAVPAKYKVISTRFVLDATWDVALNQGRSRQVCKNKSAYWGDCIVGDVEIDERGKSKFCATFRIQGESRAGLMDLSLHNKGRSISKATFTIYTTK
jgi:hypothetical protein